MQSTWSQRALPNGGTRHHVDRSTAGALPFEERAVERSSMFVYPDHIPLRTCSAEDLIVFKAFADRGQDWVDIERVLIRQQRSLDWPYILHQLGPLVAAKEALEILTKLERLRASSR